ncbi:MAG: ASCH domain-containing protein [bacterium]|nr:ASCH domain-containing protein [bacterium]
MSEKLSPRSADQTIERVAFTNEQSYSQIMSGQKTADLRAAANTLTTLKPGYIVEFRTTGVKEKISVRVKEVRKYKTVEEVLAGEDMEKLFPGMSPEEINENTSGVRGEDIKQHGGIVIEFEKVES